MITRIIMPKLGETMEEGQIGKWLKKEGERVEKGQPLFEVASDKANFEMESPATGFLRKILYEKGQTVPVTKTIGYIADSMEEQLPEETAAVSETVSSRPERKNRIKISPLARRLAEQRGIDISKINGTGPGGRITKEDVEKFQSVAKTESREVPLSAIRKIIAQRLSQSKRQAPHYYLQAEIDMSDTVRMREDLLTEEEKTSSVHLSYTDAIIRATALSLEQFPVLNSTYENGKLRSFKEVNIGVAVALQEGLVVPVIKDVANKTLWQIAEERTTLVTRAREGKLTQMDISNGTFTISNLGVFGIDLFTAIINPPQVAILAVGAIKKRPSILNDQVVVRQTMKVSLSLDHRVVDGAVGAQFLTRLRELLEKPYLLLVKERRNA
ncbi:MAG: 2-oxo acid dehydrogenase subunit E2 [Candidatus Latescibacteria bacterium]|nr:2-oxo acid dehydrogenase subunit E2 [Candidatus Latescibacterota bacterium]